MLPDQVQLNSRLELQETDYDTLKAKIKVMANVQSDHSTPQPMVEMRCYDQDVNVEPVGVQKGPAFGTCWTCAGSHFARFCPSGTNKGQKGRQRRRQGQGQREADQSNVWVLLDLRRQPLFEGCPKGDGNGAKGGSKNSGKTMKCFDCGRFGDRVAQCSTSVRKIEYDDEEDGHGDVESVSEGWDIFGLEEGKAAPPVWLLWAVPTTPSRAL